MWQWQGASVWFASGSKPCSVLTLANSSISFAYFSFMLHHTCMLDGFLCDFNNRAQVALRLFFNVNTARPTEAMVHELAWWREQRRENSGKVM